MQYTEIYSKLQFETAIILFVKRDGNFRAMLGTRNMSTVRLYYGDRGSELNGHDKRCNINNDNIAVFDLLIGEARSFNVKRLVDIKFIGEVNSKEELDNAAKQFIEFRDAYEKSKPKASVFDAV